MTTWSYVSDTELRHTYPYGRHDITVPFGDGTGLKEAVAAAFASDAACRRVVVPVEEDNKEQIGICEEAGLRYVLDVQLRTREELALMVAEPDWVTAQSTDIQELDLS